MRKRDAGEGEREAAEGGGAEGFLKCVRQRQLARGCGVSPKHRTTVLLYSGLEI